MTIHLGYDAAETIATNHEGEQIFTWNSVKDYDFLNSPNGADRIMDMYNNHLGRHIALANPDATDEQLAELVQEAISAGQMLVLVQVEDVWTWQWSDGAEVIWGDDGSPQRGD